MSSSLSAGIAITAGILNIIGFVPYVRDILRHKTKPERAMWWIYSEPISNPPSGLKSPRTGQNLPVARHRNYSYASSPRTNFASVLEQFQLGREN